MAIDIADERAASGQRADAARRLRHLRARGSDEEQRVTFVELFFHLVYVFAVTQVSHVLVDDLSAAGVAKAVFLLLVVWWAWIYGGLATYELRTRARVRSAA
jgi:low temperature requirement protein LtrA